MGTLMLFPWLKSSTEYSIGDFVLHPYVRGGKPFGEGTPEQESIDQALRPYVERGEQPIDSATILSFTDRGILNDVSEEERNEALVFSELLATSAMAQREFFDLPTHYCNRTLFELEIWSGVPEREARQVVTRRRDGVNWDVVLGEAFRRQRPDHAHGPYQCSSVADFLDEGLMAALLDAKSSLDGEEWSRFFDSVVNFNLANTDSSQPLYSIIEPIMLASAFQRLLDCGSGRSVVAQAFGEAFSPEEDLSVEECNCVPEEIKQQEWAEDKTARAAWMWEFYCVRSALAHGEQEDEEKLAWTKNQHLLIASYAFPLLLKLKLAEAGYYVRTDHDWLKIDLFEKLICTPNFDKEDEEGRFPWRQILANERIRRTFVRALENQ